MKNRQGVNAHNAIAIACVVTVHLMMLMALHQPSRGTPIQSYLDSTAQSIVISLQFAADSSPASQLTTKTPQNTDNGLRSRNHIQAADVGRTDAEPGHELSDYSQTDSKPLVLSLPKEAIPQPNHSVAQEALRDPRSNSVRLSFSEQFAVTVGAIACIFVERMPDGSIYRAPGKWVYVPDPDAIGGRKPLKVCAKDT